MICNGWVRCSAKVEYLPTGHSIWPLGHKEDEQEREHCNESSITSHLNICSSLQIWSPIKDGRDTNNEFPPPPLPPPNFGVLIKFVNLSLTMVYLVYTVYNWKRYWRDACFAWWNWAVGGQILATGCLWTLGWWCGIRHSCKIIDEYISSETN